MRRKFITKCVSFFITKCGSYCKLRQFHYKMRQLLQNATFVTNCDSTTNPSKFSQSNAWSTEISFPLLLIKHGVQFQSGNLKKWGITPVLGNYTKRNFRLTAAGRKTASGKRALQANFEF